jgi:acetoacetyl-CoA reductase
MGVDIAKAALAAGHKVVATGRNTDKVTQAVGESADLLAVKLDVTNPADAEAAVKAAVERFGRIDVLVNNAGINIDRTLKKLSVEDWDKVIQVDLNSAFYTVHAALPHMMEQGGGKIINMSSFVGEAGNIGQANYSAAKAGLLGFTKTAAKELARSGITVNAICPGFIETDMVASIPEEAKGKLLKTVPLGRFGKPEEIARAVRYLVEDGDYITGQALDINGGVYIRT